MKWQNRDLSEGIILWSDVLLSLNICIGAVFRTTFSPIVSGVFPVVSMIEKSLNLEGKNSEKLLSMRTPPPPLRSHGSGVTLAFFLP